MKEYKVEVHHNRTVWRNLKGEIHREDGPAVEWKNGNKEYYRNGNLHNENGPAIEYANGYKAYYIDGKRHRKDGPAVEFSNGDILYYINGKQLTEEEFLSRNKTCEGKTVIIEGIEYELVRK